MVFQLFLVVLGLLLLIGGGEVSLWGAKKLATKLKLSVEIVSLVIIGFGTSLPELLVNVRASLNGSSGLVLGNVIGSNMANLLLIGGVALLLSRLCFSYFASRFHSVVMLGGIILLVLIATVLKSNEIGRFVASAMLVVFVLFILFALKIEKGQHQEAKNAETTATKATWYYLFCLSLGVMLLLLGAKVLVDAVVWLALSWHISEVIIGLSIVAVGTSLPELFAAFAAVRQKQTSIIIANLVGSCIFNVWAILAISSLIRPTTIPQESLYRDLLPLLLFSLFYVFGCFSKKALPRGIGLLMIVIYCGYLSTIFLLP